MISPKKGKGRNNILVTERRGRHNVTLDAAKLVDRICIAPHRTMREKREELKRLYGNTEDESGQEQLFRTEIYYMGQKEELLPDMFFSYAEGGDRGFLGVHKKECQGKRRYGWAVLCGGQRAVAGNNKTAVSTVRTVYSAV